jgi:Spy/CpxP family protein refolding chaperone
MPPAFPRAALNKLWRFEMSTVRTLALGALMVCGVAGVAAAQSSVTPKTRADSGYHRRGDRPDGQFRKGGRGFGRDLNLTDAQKAQMKAIHQKYQPQNQALRDRAKPFMEAARTARQKGDSAGFRSNMEKAKQVMQGGQSFRTQEQAEIRAILTPEQQAKFDAHQKAAAEHRANGGKKGWGHKGQRNPADKK